MARGSTSASISRGEGTLDKIRVLIADDHPIFLEGLCTLIALKYPEIEVVAAVQTGREAVDKERELAPDMVLLDIRMPDLDGIEAARLMRQRRPELKIVMLTTFNEKDLVSEALRAGAKGFVLKQKPVSEVIHDLKAVYYGNVLISDPAAEKLDWGAETSPAGAQPAPEPEAQQVLSRLSDKDRKIFHYMLEGLDNKAIAERVFVSEGTLRNHVSRIYQTVGVHNRTALVLWAMRHEMR